MSRTTQDKRFSPLTYIGGEVFALGAPNDPTDPEDLKNFDPSKAEILAGMRLTFGTDSDESEEPPSVLTFQVWVKKSLADVPMFYNGQEIEIWTRWFRAELLFMGRIRRMTATPYHKGGLLLTITATDPLADLEEAYVSCDFASTTGQGRFNQIQNLLTAEAVKLENWRLRQSLGWPYDRARQRYNSIKVKTLVARYFAPQRVRAHFYPEFAEFVKPRTKYLQDVAPFSTTAIQPVLGVRASQTDEFPEIPVSTEWMGVTGDFSWDSRGIDTAASNVERDVEWNIDTDAIKTTLGLVTPDTPAGTDDTGTVQHDYNGTAAALRTYGTRRVTAETDLLYNGTSWSSVVADVKALYLDTDQAWTLSKVKLVDSTAAEGIMQLFFARYRAELTITISGVMPNTPTPGVPFLQAQIMGGEMVWNGQQWELELTLYKPTKLGRTPTPVTFAQIAASPTPTISAGTSKTIGRALTFDAFSYIPTTR